MPMQEIVIFGRGGQGNVAAAEILAIAAFDDGVFSQAYPFFGSERTGSPVQAYVRLDDKPIRLRTQVREADILIIQDETLLGTASMPRVKSFGTIIANSRKKPDELGIGAVANLWTLPALAIAQEVIGRPNANVVMLGAFAAVTGAVSLPAIQRATRKRFPGTPGELNSQAAERAYRLLLEEKKGYELTTGPSGAARHQPS